MAGKYLTALILFASFISCQDYLNVIPDNVSTIDHAFKLKNEAEKYLFTCYSYLPDNGNAGSNIGFLAGDEVWVEYEKGIESGAIDIARGYQSVAYNLCNVWDGWPSRNHNLWNGIRSCNTFIENVSDLNKVPDLTLDERKRWLGEAEFLKAYFHFYLLRMYGPIPIMDKNIPVDASEDEVNVERMPLDYGVDYIVALLDSAANKLPSRITDVTKEMGRITKPIALSVKAQVLLTAASPLFNGNSDYSGFVNSKGEPLISTSVDIKKWERARDAAKEAITVAESVGNELYYFEEKDNLTDTTMFEMNVRQAVCERWNSEIIWADPNSPVINMQRDCMVPLATGESHGEMRSIFSPPLKMARLFYTKNGVPINEDATLDFSNEAKIRTAISDERFNIKAGYETARLNFDREPRFYANLAFDGAVWYKFDSPTDSDEGTFHVEAKYGDYAGSWHNIYFNVTGYYIKKLVDWNMSVGTSGASYKYYFWPEIRLADLYLMYAEAKNEADGPSDEVYNYLNKIRERAGLNSVQDSWTNFSIYPTKYTTKDGLREIIHQERLIELAFEGKRYWDLRRWKKATEELNKPITGWNVYGTDNETYYVEIPDIYQQEFIAPRDYLWPISEAELLHNPKLIQNPGW